MYLVFPILLIGLLAGVRRLAGRHGVAVLWWTAGALTALAVVGFALGPYYESHGPIWGDCRARPQVHRHQLCVLRHRGPRFRVPRRRRPRHRRHRGGRRSPADGHVATARMASGRLAGPRLRGVVVVAGRLRQRLHRLVPAMGRARQQPQHRRVDPVRLCRQWPAALPDVAAVHVGRRAAYTIYLVHWPLFILVDSWHLQPDLPACTCPAPTGRWYRAPGCSSSRSPSCWRCRRCCSTPWRTRSGGDGCGRAARSTCGWR